MSEIRPKITVEALEPYTVDDITNFLVETSGLPREKILEIQAENDREWKQKYGMTAKEMEEMKRRENGTE